MVFEYLVALQVYVDTLIDINKLTYNFLHNAGSMYDLTEEAYFRFADFAAQGDTKSFWARIGFIFGNLFHNLFEYPFNYDEITDPNNYRADEYNHSEERDYV